MDLNIRMVIVYATLEVAKADPLLQNNSLQHRLAHVVPLEQIARRHELIAQGGFRGSLVASLCS